MPQKKTRKKKNKNSKVTAEAGIIAVLSVFAVTGWYVLAGGVPIQAAVSKPAAANEASKPEVVDAAVHKLLQNSIGLPKRIKIPKIKVDAAIDSVGLTPAGAVGVPKGASTTAWYNLGPRPGVVGSAVITGHYGRWKNGQGSVFDNLGKLKKGDTVSVIDDKGKTVTFVVRELRTYAPNDVVPDVFYSADGKAHLNLITCEGVWNRVLKNYSKRLVVFTDKK